MAIASINPATGELTKRFDPHTDGEIEGALDRAVSAFEKHRPLHLLNALPNCETLPRC